MTRNKIGKFMAGLLGIAALAGALWWGLFGLKPQDPSPAALQARHAHAPQSALQVQLGEVQVLPGGHRAQSLRFRSFDGQQTMGSIVYPAQAAGPVPLLLGLHAMGRNHHRMLQAEFKGRPTVERTHEVAALALARGHAVLALDAREHGERKNPEHTVLDIMNDLHWWGRREPYERMLIDTVKDYRAVLDWAVQQPGIAPTGVRVAGYSMGAQMALLLGALDARITAVAAVVPPHVDDKLAFVSPRRLRDGLAGKRVWLLTADDDEYASAADNQALFEALPGTDKRHLRFAGGHLLPAHYVESLRDWF
ncbi:dienelactone hydrolase family protein [Roseateles sp. LKC17W]|uniref:Dienelactone hydrolase family protein n=1 Tax=Pelomonas margarita TaxID=3299031 RepID=A0ABW7FGN1_9BURK